MQFFYDVFGPAVGFVRLLPTIPEFWVILIGTATGAVEIASRHSDYRFTAIRTGPGMIYILLNALICLTALELIQILKPAWLGFKDAASAGDMLLIVLAAGFGANALLRSSLFKLRTPDGDLSVGPALVMDQLLNLFDEAVDRAVGERRVIEVSEIMEGIEFDKAYKNLPTFCLASLQRLSPESQRELATEIAALKDNAELDDRVKVRSLGLKIMTRTGRPVLEIGVHALRPVIGPPGPDPVAGPGIRRPDLCRAIAEKWRRMFRRGGANGR